MTGHRNNGEPGFAERGVWTRPQGTSLRPGQELWDSPAGRSEEGLVRSIWAPNISASSSRGHKQSGHSGVGGQQHFSHPLPLGESETAQGCSSHSLCLRNLGFLWVDCIHPIVGGGPLPKRRKWYLTSDQDRGLGLLPLGTGPAALLTAGLEMRGPQAGRGGSLLTPQAAIRVQLSDSNGPGGRCARSGPQPYTHVILGAGFTPWPWFGEEPLLSHLEGCTALPPSSVGTPTVHRGGFLSLSCVFFVLCNRMSQAGANPGGRLQEAANTTFLASGSPWAESRVPRRGGRRTLLRSPPCPRHTDARPASPPALPCATSHSGTTSASVQMLLTANPGPFSRGVSCQLREQVGTTAWCDQDTDRTLIWAQLSQEPR